MVTRRELIVEFFQIIVTLLSWLFAFVAGIYLIARVLTGDGFWPVALVSNFAFYCLIPLVILAVLGVIARTKWGLLTSVPFAIIALIWFGPYFLPKGAVTTSNPTLKIVTLNYYRSNQQISLASSWLLTTDPDVIVLQEVPTRVTIPILLRFRENYPYSASHTAIGAEWGNVFLSRFPIVDTEWLNSPTDAAPNTQQRYELDMNGQHIAVYNVDIPPAYGNSRFEVPFFSNFLVDYATGYNDDLRNFYLQRIVNRVSRETMPFIVAGDFNLSEQSVYYFSLAGVMGDSYRERGSGLGATWPVTSVQGSLPGFVPPLLRVDYIWHSRDFRAIQANVGVPVGSDHLPVYAKLEILPG